MVACVAVKLLLSSNIDNYSSIIYICVVNEWQFVSLRLSKTILFRVLLNIISNLLKVKFTIMSRYKLISAIKEAAGLIGYTFYTGPDEAMTSKIKSYPALWLSSTVMKNMSGRAHCRDLYGICMTLMMSPKVSADTAREEVWRVLEDDAALLRQKIMSHKNVRKVSDFCTASPSKPFTKNGETTLTAQCDILMCYFFKDRG